MEAKTIADRAQAVENLVADSIHSCNTDKDTYAVMYAAINGMLQAADSSCETYSAVLAALIQHVEEELAVESGVPGGYQDSGLIKMLREFSSRLRLARSYV